MFPKAIFTFQKKYYGKMKQNNMTMDTCVVCMNFKYRSQKVAIKAQTFAGFFGDLSQNLSQGRYSILLILFSITSIGALVELNSLELTVIKEP